MAEVGASADLDQLFHLLYDGTVIDEHRFAVLGGDAETVTERVREGLGDSPDLATALGVAAHSLSGPDRALTGADLEVALLERSATRRCFRRLDDAEVAEILGSAGSGPAPSGTDGDAAAP